MFRVPATAGEEQRRRYFFSISDHLIIEYFHY